MSILNAPHFHNEEAAYEFVEARIWANGRVCPHCGVVDNSGKLKGNSTRIGVYKCYACRKPFTVKVGTIFESSHVKLHLWLQAMFLICSSKKGISSNQLHRTLGVTLKTAWFMSHRIREAMNATGTGPLGGEGMTIEADETFIGPSAIDQREDGTLKRKRGTSSKRVVVSLVERGGRVRSVHAESIKGAEIRRIVLENADKASRLITDDAPHYRIMGEQFARHDRIKHSTKIYGKGDVHTNVIEGYFSIFKRGMVGTYQHCGEQHLHRYLAEFDFRYNNRKALGVDDVERTVQALKGVVGKRLTYRTTGERA
jgi:transposase-like protein